MTRAIRKYTTKDRPGRQDRIRRGERGATSDRLFYGFARFHDIERNFSYRVLHLLPLPALPTPPLLLLLVFIRVLLPLSSLFLSGRCLARSGLLYSGDGSRPADPASGKLMSAPRRDYSRYLVIIFPNLRRLKSWSDTWDLRRSGRACSDARENIFIFLRISFSFFLK